MVACLANAFADVLKDILLRECPTEDDRILYGTFSWCNCVSFERQTFFFD